MRPYLRDLADRAARTVCQSAAAMLVADGTGLLDTDWPTVASVAGMAGIVSVLMNVAQRGITGRGE
jgi:hypothetical protein